MEDKAMNQPITWPHSGYTYFPKVRGVISMALKVNTPYNIQLYHLAHIISGQPITGYRMRAASTYRPMFKEMSVKTGLNSVEK